MTSQIKCSHNKGGFKKTHKVKMKIRINNIAMATVIIGWLKYITNLAMAVVLLSEKISQKFGKNPYMGRNITQITFQTFCDLSIFSSMF